MPLKLTGDDIRNREFPMKMRGYHPLEVDAFLLAAGGQVDALVRQNEELTQQCTHLFDQLGDLKKDHDNLQKALISVNELRDEAQARAQEAMRRAEEDAGRILREAGAQAEEMRADAERESARLQEEVSHLVQLRDKLLVDLCEMFRSHIRILEGESRRLGVDLANLLGEDGSENVVQLNQKAEGDGS